MRVLKRTTKLRMRRVFKRRRRQAEEMSVQAGDQFDKMVVRRWGHLRHVWRFIFGWVGLTILMGVILVFQTLRLSTYYLKATPIPGGTYTEGVLGSFTNTNPLYATSTVDNTVSHLLFSGLMDYDQNGALVGQLASSIDVDETGKQYIVHLRPNLTWHDHVPLTADDVVFTYTTIQNPDARSPLQSSWQGVKVEARDPNTVIFTLPNPLSSFPYSLTTGIIPKHSLASVPIPALRSASFNTASPIGSGPFRWSNVLVVGADVDTREERITLLPFENYAAGKPKLDSFVVRSFRTEQAMINAYSKQELTGMVGLNSMTQKLAADKRTTDYSFPLSSGVYVFLKNTEGDLSDVRLRKALEAATDPSAIENKLDYPTIPVREPFLVSHRGFYNPTLQQQPFNLAGANQLLDEDGWVKGADGIRTKDGRKLILEITTQQGRDYEKVVNQIIKQWSAVGVKATSNVVTDREIEPNYIVPHNYQVLVYGISIGPDPDVYAYWHSSQADIHNGVTHLNLSEYRSAVADKALEAGRTRNDVAIRSAKYRPFLEAWRDDAPAIGLYQPRFLYLTSTKVNGLTIHQLNDPAERLANVENWMINTNRTTE